MVMCPTQTLTHQLQPGIRYEHLVLLVLKTKVEQRQNESEGFFLYKSEEPKQFIFNQLENAFVISKSLQLFRISKEEPTTLCETF